MSAYSVNKMGSSSSGRFGVTFTLLATTVGSISLLQSIMSPVLPTLQKELDTTPNAVSWVMIAFLLTGAIGTPILARLGDMIGKVRTLRIALGAIVAGNLVSAIAPSIEILVLGRAIQGAGLCAFPLTFGILRDESPSDRIVASISTMSSVIAVGGGLGADLARYLPVPWWRYSAGARCSGYRRWLSLLWRSYCQGSCRNRPSEPAGVSMEWLP